ncbi:MAG: Unknown protein [uncultured Thiotrichaceae bacterium]|uniref:Multiple resistance and pH regulation protein F n=1 Tax=uncultured Thiotrichaceae bacterium TaxID=298394 RepID=A0A6S6SHX0_9GAMM|nr:MAG: Unknown protein [uncultured Thiotrichaceae bacterium]
MIADALTTSFSHFAVLIAMGLLLVGLAVGLIRSYVGPDIEDRFTALLLLGTGGAALLLLLAFLLNIPALYDVALVLALLAVVITVAVTRKETSDD